MKETAKALLRKNKNELPAARALEVSLDRADNVIEGGPHFSLLTHAHGGMIPLQYVNAKDLI
jgi:hypothetical protein